MFKLYILLYTVLMYLVQPFMWFWLLWKSVRASCYKINWLNRYGFYFLKKNKVDGIILHAVSLGETISMVPLIQELRKYYPDIVITLTSTTFSGLRFAQRFALSNNNVQCVCFPHDLPGSMKRFVKQFNPKLVIVVETELWPNFINVLYQNKIPLIIVNARLSISSFLKYKKIIKFFRFIMKRVTMIAAQHESDASRFFELGVSKDQLYVTGNLKFNVSITRDLFNQIVVLKNAWTKDRLIWIASSTHSGEEFILLKVHKILLENFPNLLLILAPRHPERFFSVCQITENFGFSYVKKSSDVVPSQDVQVVINDTIGELMLLYGISDIAFIGGSLVRCGGHNPLEPAIHSIPIIMGPYTFNFNDICVKLSTLKGLIRVSDVDSLVRVMSILLKDKNLRQYYGLCAFNVFKDNQGALRQLICLLRQYLVF